MKTLKEWRFEIAARFGIKPESVYMRLKRGSHPEVKIIKQNHQRQFVKTANQMSTELTTAAHPARKCGSGNSERSCRRLARGISSIDDMKFQLGDKVKWSSQAGGFRRDKQGEIVQVVPAGARPDRARFAQDFVGHGFGLSRKHESYVVAITHPTRRTRHYWPRQSLLMPV